MAKKLLVLSAAAYSKQPELCLKSHFDVVEMVNEVTVDCGRIFDHDCYAYVALLHTKKAIAIGYRGSTSAFQLLSQALSLARHKVHFLDGKGKINQYFYRAYQAIWDEMEAGVIESLKKYPDYNIWITGHSLGGALASLTSVYMIYNGTVKLSQTENYSFGQPRVGDKESADYFHQLVPNFYRVAHAKDIVTVLFPRRFDYRHFPTEVWYDNDMTENSSYVLCKTLTDPECYSEDRNNVEDHSYYFNVHIARYGKAGCPMLNLNTTDDDDYSSSTGSSFGYKIQSVFLTMMATIVNWLFLP
ncbi:unnamed protein product [Bursaphelenchus okinawaensis]|uniref:Fungal lipase-type domain-containing protein n=1 Tax=Bursaphelenchus okinawaensis TaxID=465554 RepID=A0A811L8E3_9BILA|nr:unnamed protein product [Bursaphelenchus okinawaensis]CAG9117788.1 unnamed protein product [Bursaphelenchus okinawaensis]